MKEWQAVIGRRGIALLTLAVVDVSYGGALLAGYTPATLATELAPGSTWGTIWIVVGLLLITGAVTPVDAFAFALATLLKFSWAVLIFVDLVEHHSPGGWGPAMPWLGLAGLVILIASWSEVHA